MSVSFVKNIGNIIVLLLLVVFLFAIAFLDDINFVIVASLLPAWYFSSRLAKHTRWHNSLASELQNFHPILFLPPRSQIIAWTINTFLNALFGLIILYATKTVHFNIVNRAMIYSLIFSVAVLISLIFNYRYFKHRLPAKHHIAEVVLGSGILIFMISIVPFFIITIFLFFVFIIYWRQQLLANFVQEVDRLLEQGNYLQALNVNTNFPNRYKLSVIKRIRDYNHAWLLRQFEQYAQAYAIYSLYLSDGYNMKFTPQYYLSLLQELGLMEMRRNNHVLAEKYFQTGINFMERTGFRWDHLYDNLSEAYLQQKKSPEIALQHLASKVIAVGQNFNIQLKRNIAFMQAARAWALILLGRSTEANAIVLNQEEVFRDSPRQYANYTYRLGQVNLAQNQHQLAYHYFQQASLADSEGEIGRNALIMMHFMTDAFL